VVRIVPNVCKYAIIHPLIIVHFCRLFFSHYVYVRPCTWRCSYGRVVTGRKSRQCLSSLRQLRRQVFQSDDRARVSQRAQRSCQSHHRSVRHLAAGVQRMPSNYTLGGIKTHHFWVPCQNRERQQGADLRQKASSATSPEGLLPILFPPFPPLSSLPSFLPSSRSRPLKFNYSVCGIAVSSVSGAWGGAPCSGIWNLVHFSRKIWHLVATTLILF